jgi:pSer/pThr/pTyr-binding forkhead associated (FHA) protein
MGPFAQLYNTLGKFDATGQTGTNGTVVNGGHIMHRNPKNPLKNNPEVKLPVTAKQLEGITMDPKPSKTPS